MSDQLATEMRRVVDAGAPTITLDELDLVSLAATRTRPRRRVSFAIAAAFAVLLVASIAAVALVARDGSKPELGVSPRGATCPESTPNLELFMQVAATQEQVEAVDAALQRQPGVCVVRFVDNEAAYAEFKRLFAHQPDLTRDVTPDDLPVSFRVAVDGEPSDELIASLEALPGVETIRTLSG